uniref:Uncharacterized protein n=1 Tax=Cairina moschata TaxID=8855 RepID=A0A8C3BYU9_CAIMO
MERTPLAGVGLGSAEDYSSLTDTRQILYYYKALFTKGQFLHFIAACKRLPDFTSICCTSDFTPVCFVLRSGKLMLCISKMCVTILCVPLLLRTRGLATRQSKPHIPASESISSSVGWFFSITNKEIVFVFSHLKFLREVCGFSTETF